MHNFCVSLTTIPSRFNRVAYTVEALNKQTRQPDKIFLNIPKEYKRFPNNNFDISGLLNIKSKNLEIVRCDDFGPGTKLLGSINSYTNYDYVILIDDDHIYKPEMLEIFYNHASKSLESAYSFAVFDIEDCKVGQGADGYLINVKHLNSILNFYKKYVSHDEKLFFNDDLWISIYLNKVLKIDIKNLSSFIKKRFFSKSTSVYKKHTTVSALIETYSKNRKEARKLKYIENCDTYLSLKEKTNNFTDL